MVSGFPQVGDHRQRVTFIPQGMSLGTSVTPRPLSGPIEGLLGGPHQSFLPIQHQQMELEGNCVYQHGFQELGWNGKGETS